ncbi:MAG: Na(+)-translocating NADH-quinone reductase subunit A [Myxococcota bacterium]|nr:Na(+)-translocating NADH-quinone reductase subunit A [Myxococcota bacterium]
MSSPRRFHVRRGLDLPILGVPEQVVEPARAVSTVGLTTRSFAALKPRALVSEGDRVQLGQPLLEDRRLPQLRFTSPGTGRVRAIHRGERRHILSVVVDLDPGAESQVSFASFSPKAQDSTDGVRALLLESGLWTALRIRPYGHLPLPEASPQAIFITALDTHPLAPQLDVVLQGREQDFDRGLEVLGKLTSGPLYVCRAPGSKLGDGSARATLAEFSGKHPAGTVGFHIHSLNPVHRRKTVWHLGAQDVARIGRLFATGELDVSVVIALGGPLVRRPRLLRTRLGAPVGPLTDGELSEGEARVVSGSVLHGDQCADEREAFLGRYHQQLSVLAEGRRREFLGWLAPGPNEFSVLPTFLSALMPNKRFAFHTNLRGGRRAMVPIGAYERVMPMDLMPTHLLRAVAAGDLEWAEELGALELEEEDVALCSFVCPGKNDYGPALRRVLESIHQEG